MPDVSIGNTIVQEDLASSESVTVPTGESWDVAIIAKTGSSSVELNAEIIIDQDNFSDDRTVIPTVLHESDTITADGGSARIRGWVVRS